MNHKEIIAQFSGLRSNMTEILERAKNASQNLGGIADTKPDDRTVAKLESEILRLRPIYLEAHTAFLAAIDA